MRRRIMQNNYEIKENKGVYTYINTKVRNAFFMIESTNNVHFE